MSTPLPAPVAWLPRAAVPGDRVEHVLAVNMQPVVLRAQGTDTQTMAVVGNLELVRVLRAARASGHAQMPDGATALSEAIRGGHDDVAILLRAAGAGTGDPPVERGAAPVEAGRPEPRPAMPR